ncbi:MAG: hypothetical protein ACR2O3_12940 [Rhizobiaceae bacterium]
MNLESTLLRVFLEQQGSDLPGEMRSILGGMLSDDDATIINSTAKDITDKTTVADKATVEDLDLRMWQEEAAKNERIIEALSGKLEMLACALGACPSCWGADGPCDSCDGHGRGGPGRFLPDPDCFDAMVTPVLHSMVDGQGTGYPNVKRKPSKRPREGPGNDAVSIAKVLPQADTEIQND